MILNKKQLKDVQNYMHGTLNSMWIDKDDMEETYGYDFYSAYREVVENLIPVDGKSKLAKKSIKKAVKK